MGDCVDLPESKGGRAMWPALPSPHDRADLKAAWDAVHDATPEGWYVGHKEVGPPLAGRTFFTVALG